MPDSAVKRDPDSKRDESAARSHRPRAARTQHVSAAQTSVDTEKKLARAARSAQRLAQLSDDPRDGETLDLFAEDAERAQLQARNTDIRQGTFEGFELPDVFLAAVQSPSGAKRAARDSAVECEPVPSLFQDDLLRVDAAPPDEPSRSATALIPHERDDAPPLAKARTIAPELDRARATAFADTVDALYAVVVEQRTSMAAHARRMKTMLTIIVCAMLVTVTMGIAQTAVLLRMSRDSALQQDRTQQLMLDRQATLALTTPRSLR